MEFETQKQLLEYLWKNGNDRSLVQRMMIRGEVYKENGMYILVDKDKKIEELISEVQKLRSEIATVKESNWDYEEAKAQWEHWQAMARYNKLLLDTVLDVVYDTIKPALRSKLEWKEEFIDWVMEKAMEIVWPFKD